MIMNNKAEELMRKYHYGFKHSNDLLEDEYVKDLNKEIERLNNIIVELKKDLIKEIDSLQNVEVESKEDIRCRTLCNVLDKLSDLIGELKEGK